MSLKPFDWSEHLSPGMKVSFSSLALDEERDEFERSVAQIELSPNVYLDIGWDDGAYTVSVFNDRWESMLFQGSRKTPIGAMLMSINLLRLWGEMKSLEHEYDFVTSAEARITQIGAECDAERAREGSL